MPMKKKWMPVEVQFRTIAMDFWASIEHKVKYKKNIDDSTAEIVEKTKRMCGRNPFSGYENAGDQ